MMPKAGPPPAIFMGISTIFTLITGLGLSLFYNFSNKILSPGYWQKVIKFTVIAAGLMLIFSYLPMILLINLPLELITIWFISAIVSTFFGTMVFAKMIK